MKNLLVFASVLLVSGMVMWSCEKDAQLTPTVQSTNSDIEFVNSIIDDFDTEYASFQTEEEMTKFIKAYLGLTYEEQEEVLGTLKFQTLNNYISTAYDGMITLETERDFEVYVNNYSDFLEIVPIANGEREVIEKESTIHVISPFVNMDRIVKIGDVFKKYVGTYVVEATNVADLKGIKSVSDVLSSRLNYTNLLSSSRNDLFDVKEYELVNDNRWCKDDRKVILEAWFQITNATSGTGYDVAPTVDVIAKRKGIPCVWYKYNTNITWTNFHFKASLDGIATLDWEIPQTISAYDKEIRLTTINNIYSGYFNPAPNIMWTKQRSSVTTTGLGAQNLEVNL